MIDINLLPPKERPASSGRTFGLVLLLGGVLIGGYFVYEYVQTRQATDALNVALVEMEQQQLSYQQELQTLGPLGGGPIDADLLEELRQRRPDLNKLLNLLQSPLKSGGKLETVQLDQEGLIWTCLFPGLKEASVYVSTLGEQAGAGGDSIRSLVEVPGRGYVGTFSLAALPVTIEEQAGETP